jgi:Mg2+-importing ATPase
MPGSQVFVTGGLEKHWMTVVAPYTPVVPILGFEPLPGLFLIAVAAIVAAYVVAAEAAKRLFYRKVHE